MTVLRWITFCALTFTSAVFVVILLRKKKRNTGAIAKYIAGVPEVLTAKKNSNLLTSSEACLLTSLVSSGSEKTLLCRALVTIGNKAAFTDNQNVLREAGCLQRLSAMLKSYKCAIAAGQEVDPECLQCLLTAVNNLAMNENNQSLLAECIPMLASFASLHTDSAVRIASLQALTNLSVTPAYHRQFIPFVGAVIGYSTDSTDVKLTLQSLRLLVNLTLSREFVHHMLQEKDPSYLLDILDKYSEPDVILRVLTCLLNIHSVVIKSRTTESLTEPQTSAMSCPHSELPTVTVFFTDYSFDDEYLRRLREKLHCLCEHCDTEVQDSALRLLLLCR